MEQLHDSATWWREWSHLTEVVLEDGALRFWQRGKILSHACWLYDLLTQISRPLAHEEQWHQHMQHKPGCLYHN